MLRMSLEEKFAPPHLQSSLRRSAAVLQHGVQPASRLLWEPSEAAGGRLDLALGGHERDAEGAPVLARARPGLGQRAGVLRQAALPRGVQLPALIHDLRAQHASGRACQCFKIALESRCRLQDMLWGLPSLADNVLAKKVLCI